MKIPDLPFEVRGVEDAQYFLENVERVFRKCPKAKGGVKRKTKGQSRFLQDWRIGVINTNTVEKPGEDLNGSYQRGDVVIYREEKRGGILIAYPPYRHRLQSDLDRDNGYAILRHPRLQPINKRDVTDLCSVC